MCKFKFNRMDKTQSPAKKKIATWLQPIRWLAFEAWDQTGPSISRFQNGCFDSWHGGHPQQSAADCLWLYWKPIQLCTRILPVWLGSAVGWVQPQRPVVMDAEKQPHQHTGNKGSLLCCQGFSTSATSESSPFDVQQCCFCAAHQTGRQDRVFPVHSEYVAELVTSNLRASPINLYGNHGRRFALYVSVGIYMFSKSTVRSSTRYLVALLDNNNSASTVISHCSSIPSVLRHWKYLLQIQMSRCCSVECI